MNWGVENVDVRISHCYINSHTLYESNNHKSMYSTKKMGLKLSQLICNGEKRLQDSLYIDVMLPASTLHQYANTE